jgi:pimeloyl-ACP methyl ester carboxylesterase
MSQTLLTDDGVRIAAEHVRPANPSSALGLAIVHAHGFTGSLRSPAVRRVVRALSAYGGVVSFDFRGHGRSAGMSTVGDKEVLDLDAVVRWARWLGYVRVATVGWSMGAAVAVRHAAIHRGVDAVVAISGPSRWYYRGTVPMRRAHWAFERPHGRALLRYLWRTRIDPYGWNEGQPSTWPESPRDAARRIAPTPFLVVHGDADHYFPLDHAHELAAAEGAVLWVMQGLGHAEAAATPAVLDRIGRWVQSVTADRSAVAIPAQPSGRAVRVQEGVPWLG